MTRSPPRYGVRPAYDEITTSLVDSHSAVHVAQLRVDMLV